MFSNRNLLKHIVHGHGGVEIGHGLPQLIDVIPFVGDINRVEEWKEFLTAYRSAGMPAVHHSEEYRIAEKPAYRIVRVELLAEYTEQI